MIFTCTNGNDFYLDSCSFLILILLINIKGDDDEELIGIHGGSFSKRIGRKYLFHGAGSDPGTCKFGGLSTASSQDSLHSNGGEVEDVGEGHHGSLTHLRYYHVFKEGELDYLINTFVENLHIISSYHDHSNWCVVAEKVNVWTL